MAKILKINSDNNQEKHKSNVSIGVVSTGYLTSQQKWIVKSYSELHNQNKNLNFLIISCYIDVGFFKHLHPPRGENHVLEVISTFNDKLKLVDWNYFIQKANADDLIQLSSLFDVVFWDFPEIEFLKKNDEIFSKYIPLINDLKILSQNVEQQDLNEFPESVRKYFREHGLPLDERNKIRPERMDKTSTIRSRLEKFFKKVS